jgi:D-beta-D-heptose 7-phosphate kinase/D-beta-D-heptose 1-phosphate adenosyltransferase
MKYAIVSGYFNPLHVGHLDYMQAAKDLGDKLIVIVNSDYQVTLKGSTPFMNQSDRLKIIKALKCVDRVYLSTDKDGSVLGTLKHVLVQNQANGRNSFLFCNGGDRSDTNTPEERLCRSNSYHLTSVYNVGGEKRQSSSEIISKAAGKDGCSQI